MALTKTKINLGTEGNLSGSRSLLGIENTLVSSSAQLATSISGSFTAASSSFSTRVAQNEASASSLTSDSGSFSTRVTRNEATGSSLTTASSSFSNRTSTLEGSGTAQGTGTTNSPTFADGTYTSNLGVSGSLTVKGMVTAEEFHTEFVSASIVYKSGSTKFGDDIDDIHSFTGSINQSGSFNLNDGNMTIADTLTATNITGTTIKDFSTISGSATSTGSFGMVGIGETVPLGKLHVKSGDSGGSANAAVDELVVEGSGDSGIQILSGNGSSGRILFGDDGANNAGQLKYNHSTDAWEFYSGAGPGGEIITFIDGKVGIGTGSPSTLLELALAQPLLTISSYAAASSTTGVLAFNSSTNATVGSHTVVDAEDQLGIIDFRGSDGDSFEVGARILAVADETFSASARGSYLSFHTVDNTTTTLDERVRIDHNGNVGIGTNNPGRKLHLYDAGSLSFGVEAAGDAAAYANYRCNSGASNIYFGAESSGGGDLVGSSAGYSFVLNQGSNAPIHLATSNTIRMTISGSGNVGIGTTSPTYKLHAYSNETGKYTAIIDQDHTGGYGLKIETDGTSTGAALRIDTGTGGDIFRVQGDGVSSFGGNVGIGTTSPDTWLHVSGSGGHLLYVSESGAYPRVGIGTTAPAAFLDVWVSANSYTKSYGNSFYQLSDNGGTTVFTVKGTGAADLVNIFDNTTEVFTILDGGNVGIGTTAPPVALTVEGTISGSAITSKGDITLDNSVANGANLILKSSGNTDWSMDNSSGDFRLFRAGDQVGLGITANYSASFYGNVGIGTTAPEGILEIGDISTGPGGMLIKRMTIVEDVATTFWTTPGANEWAGIVEITAVATDDVNRSAYQLSRFAYDDAFTSLISSAQNTSITLSIASTTQMQITMTGAGSTNYRLVIRIMGSEES